jgi:hypothetical protein
MARERECFVCGCTDERACPGGCAWAAKDLVIKVTKRGKPGEVRRSICTRCAYVLERLDSLRKTLGVKDAERVTFELGAFAALRLANGWRGGDKKSPSDCGRRLRGDAR